MAKWTINVCVIILIFALGFYLGSRSLGTTSQGINIDSLQNEIVKKNKTLDSLTCKYDSLGKSKVQRIEVVKNLGARESVTYLEEKVDIGSDSLKFFSNDSSVIVSQEALHAINVAIEEGLLAKEHLVIADSIISVQGDILADKDSVIEAYKTEVRSLKKKNKKKFIEGAGIGIGGLALLIILL